MKMAGFRAENPAGVRVCVEIFACAYEAKMSVRYHRQVKDVSQSSQDPDDAVLEVISGLGIDAHKDVQFSHSTSWRFEPDNLLMLTYIVWIPGKHLKALPARIFHPDGVSPPAGAGPLHPRPLGIAEEHVLAHGLGHLSHLLCRQQNTDVVSALSHPETKSFFDTLEPQFAGRYPHCNNQAPRPVDTRPHDA